MRMMAPLSATIIKGVAEAQLEGARQEHESKREALQAEEMEQAAIREGENIARERQDAAELAQARAQETARAQVQEQEAARVQRALPARDLRPENETRLRGGAQRLEARRLCIERLQKNDFTPEEIEGMADVMGMGAQVNPRTIAAAHSAALHKRVSLFGMAGMEQSQRAAPHLFEHLQRSDLASAQAGFAAQLAVEKMFKLTGDKEAKKATAMESYAEFVEFMRKSKVLSRNNHEKDPESFWQMHWHSQSVQHLYVNYSWPIAYDYH